MPGIWISSTYVALPVIRRGSSRRRMLLPTRVSVLVMVVAPMSVASLGCGGAHGLHDVLVAGATAEVSFEAVADLVVSRVRIALEQLLRGHDHAGRAVSALEAVLIPEGFLDGMQVAVDSEAF